MSNGCAGSSTLQKWQLQGVVGSVGDHPIYNRLLKPETDDACFDKVTVSELPTEPDHLASKAYVDSKFTDGLAVDWGAVPITGGSITGLTSMTSDIIKLPNTAKTYHLTLTNAPLITFDTTFQFPPDKGDDGWVLTTDGNGITTWTAGSTAFPAAGHYEFHVGANNGLTMTNVGTFYNGTATVSHEIELPQDLQTDANVQFTSMQCATYGIKGSTSGMLTLKVPAVTTNHDLVLPANNAGGFLKNDAFGNLSYTFASYGRHKVRVGSNGLVLGTDQWYDGSSDVIHEVSLPQNLTVLGNPVFVSVTHTSDERLKAKIEPLGCTLDRLDKLGAKTFLWRNKEFPSGRQIGLIAQDVRKQFPEAISDRDGALRMNDSALVGVLVKAVQELRQEIRDLRDLRSR